MVHLEKNSTFDGKLTPIRQEMWAGTTGNNFEQSTIIIILLT